MLETFPFNFGEINVILTKKYIIVKEEKLEKFAFLIKENMEYLFNINPKFLSFSFCNAIFVFDFKVNEKFENEFLEFKKKFYSLVLEYEEN